MQNYNSMDYALISHYNCWRIIFPIAVVQSRNEGLGYMLVLSIMMEVAREEAVG